MFLRGVAQTATRLDKQIETKKKKKMHSDDKLVISVKQHVQHGITIHYFSNIVILSSQVSIQICIPW